MVEIMTFHITSCFSTCFVLFIFARLIQYYIQLLLCFSQAWMPIRQFYRVERQHFLPSFNLLPDSVNDHGEDIFFLPAKHHRETRISNMDSHSFKSQSLAKTLFGGIGNIGTEGDFRFVKVDHLTRCFLVLINCLENNFSFSFI